MLSQENRRAKAAKNFRRSFQSWRRWFIELFASSPSTPKPERKRIYEPENFSRSWTGFRRGKNPFRNSSAAVIGKDENLDLAFGGAFYAYVNASEVGLRCRPEDFRQLIEKGMRIKRAVMASRTIPHPFEEDLSFLYGTIFVGEAEDARHHSRNVCIFAEGEVDRSPTGTGVSGRLAIHHARGELGVGESITIESIIGSTFTGRVAQETSFGPHAAIIPEVEGTAHITGRHEFLIDPADELRNGFLLR